MKRSFLANLNPQHKGRTVTTTERIYQRYTDTSNWERVTVLREHDGIVLTQECMGTGSPRSLELRSDDAEWIRVKIVAGSRRMLAIEGDPNRKIDVEDM